jgi:hypothetical protein
MLNKSLKDKLTEIEDENAELWRQVDRLKYQIKTLQQVFITAGITIKRDGQIAEGIVMFDGEPYSVLRDR